VRGSGSIHVETYLFRLKEVYCSIGEAGNVKREDDSQRRDPVKERLETPTKFGGGGANSSKRKKG